MAPKSKRRDLEDVSFKYVRLSVFLLLLGFLTCPTVWNFFLVSAAIVFVILTKASQENGLLYLAKLFVILDIVYLSVKTPAPTISYIASEALNDLYLTDASNVVFRIVMVGIIYTVYRNLTRLFPLYLLAIHAFEVPYIFPLFSLVSLDYALKDAFEEVILSSLARMWTFARTFIGVDVATFTVISYSLLGFIGLLIGLAVRAFTLSSVSKSYGKEGVSNLLFSGGSGLAFVEIITFIVLAQFLLEIIIKKRFNETSRE